MGEEGTRKENGNNNPQEQSGRREVGRALNEMMVKYCRAFNADT